MPIVVWSIIVLVAVGGTVLVNRRKRKKYAALAAHMTQAGITDSRLNGSLASSDTIAPGVLVESFKPHLTR
jgi:hypothetical protein